MTQDQVTLERKALEEVWKEIVEVLLKDVTSKGMPPYAVEWINQLLDYTVPGGKMNRALACVETFQILCKHNNREITEQEMKEIRVLGWCVEIMQAFFLVADDLMDASEMRRDKPAWWKRVGFTAENDAFLLESSMYRLIQHYFTGKPWYLRLFDLVHQVVYQTALGQLLDLTSLKQGRFDEAGELAEKNLDNYSLEAYNRIVKYKTVSYSFYLPIAMGYIAFGIEDDALFKEAYDICLVMGTYFQIQDDFLDAFGKPEEIGKVGTDIQEKKLTWLAATFLSIVNDPQNKEDEKILKAKNTFVTKYGSQDDDDVALIKQIYRDFNLTNRFEVYEKESEKELLQLIDGVKEVPKEIFNSFWKKIYKRKK